MKCISPNLKNLRKGVLAYWYIPREERGKIYINFKDEHASRNTNHETKSFRQENTNFSFGLGRQN